MPVELEDYGMDMGPSGFDDDPVEDAPNNLVEQLKAYKLLKEAADWLGQLEGASLAQYGHNNLLPEPEQFELEVSLQSLAAAWLRMDTSLKGTRKPIELRRVELSVPERVQQLLSWLKSRPRALFSQFLPFEWSKGYVVVTFLATLELARQNLVRLQQTSIHDDIEITLLREEKDAHH